jgi:hypothetical protein
MMASIAMYAHLSIVEEGRRLPGAIVVNKHCQRSRGRASFYGEAVTTLHVVYSPTSTTLTGTTAAPFLLPRIVSNIDEKAYSVFLMSLRSLLYQNVASKHSVFYSSATTARRRIAFHSQCSSSSLFTWVLLFFFPSFLLSFFPSFLLFSPLPVSFVVVSRC